MVFRRLNSTDNTSQTVVTNMQLCDKDIHQALSNGDLLIVGSNAKYPFMRDVQVQPASVDLRLGNRIMRFKDDVQRFDIKDIKNIIQSLTVTYVKDGQPIEIGPNEVLFGQIYEQISIPNNLSARIEGRSRVARLGVSVHCTGDYINPGFAGAMPLQIINHNKFPIVLYPYIGICQMILYELSKTPLVSYLERSSLPYNTYYNEDNPSPSVLSSNTEEAPAQGNLVEYRIKQLVENYYGTLEKEVGKSSNAQQLINDATTQNYQSLITVMKGTLNMGDQYSAKQVGIMGKKAGENATIYQTYNETDIRDTDIENLIQELNQAKQYIKENYNDDEHDLLVADITNSTIELKNGDKNKAIEYLKKGGRLLFDIALKTSSTVLAYYIKHIMGL